MKKLILPLIPLLAAALVTPQLLWAAQAPSTNTPAPAKAPVKNTNLFPDTVLAKGKGVQVMRSQLDEKVIRLKSQQAGRGQPIPAERTTEVEQAILTQMIQMQLLKAKLTEADLIAGKALAQKRFDDAKARFGSDEAFDRQLKLAGMTREDFLRDLTDAAAADSYIKRELKVSVTDADAKKFYDENPGRFEQPEMVKVSHILLATQDPQTRQELSADKKAAKRKQAEDVLKRARAGEDFAKLAKDFSEDPGSKDKGGEYTFGRNQMVKEFEAASFALSTNQISDIVTTQFGYHIIKLLEKIPAKKLELAKISPELKEGLTNQALQKQLPDYMAKMEKEAGVEILDEKLKPKETATTPGLPAGHPPIGNQPAPKTK